MTVSTEDFVAPVDDLRKAGLFPEGFFHWRCIDVKPVEGLQFKDSEKLGRKEGDRYPAIQMVWEAFEQAIYDEEGRLTGTEELAAPRIFRTEIDPKGGTLVMLKTAFKAITGRTPEGTFNEDAGEYQVNYLDLAQECKGGDAWNMVRHSKPTPKGDVYANMGYNFSNKPWNTFGKKRD